jgi:hypothetical protein
MPGESALPELLYLLARAVLLDALEAALVDRETREIGALNERDARRFREAVAGPTARRPRTS